MVSPDNGDKDLLISIVNGVGAKISNNGREKENPAMRERNGELRSTKVRRVQEVKKKSKVSRIDL